LEGIGSLSGKRSRKQRYPFTVSDVPSKILKKTLDTVDHKEDEDLTDSGEEWKPKRHKPNKPNKPSQLRTSPRKRKKSEQKRNAPKHRATEVLNLTSTPNVQVAFHDRWYDAQLSVLIVMLDNDAKKTLLVYNPQDIQKLGGRKAKGKSLLVLHEGKWVEGTLVTGTVHCIEDMSHVVIQEVEHFHVL